MKLATQKLLERIDREHIPYIPISLDRVGEAFNIVQGRYTLIGSIAKVGKTSLVDDIFVLKPYDWLQTNKVPIKYTVLYFSMERRKEIKLAKFLSWKFYHEQKKRISSEVILGNRKPLRDSEGNIVNPNSYYRELTKQERADIDKYKDWLDELQDHVIIKDGTKSVLEISTEIDKLAKSLGTLFTTDNQYVYKNGVRTHITFGKEFMNVDGAKMPIVRFKYKVN